MLAPRVLVVLSLLCAGAALTACENKLVVAFADNATDDDDKPQQHEPAPPACSAPESNAPPQTPQLLSPLAGRIDVTANDLVLTSSGFADDDGDAVAAFEAELWRVKDGVPDERVWLYAAASVPETLHVADGVFDADSDEAAVGLREWKDYVARVRMKDDSGACNAWSAWSADVGFRVDDGSTAFFDPSVVRTIELTLSQDSIDGLNSTAQASGCVYQDREAFEGTLQIGDDVFPGVGVRLKGGCGSSRNMEQKASFKISLNWDDPDVPGCPVERRYAGQKTITLNAAVQDNTMQHERFAYALHRAAGVPAPRVASVRLVVNGEYWGLYQNIETIDRRFLSRFYANNDGMMYEGAYWCDLLQENVPDTIDGETCFQREFTTDACDTASAGREATDWQALQNFVDGLDAVGSNDFAANIGAVVDWDRFLSMWAVDGVLSHWDGYGFHIINNYRVYHAPDTDLVSILPWGIDQTFNGGGDVDPWSSDARLVNACLADPACEAQFAARLEEVVTLFESMDFASQADAMHTLIHDDVYADPRKEISNQQWEDNHAQMLAWIGQRPARMRQYLQAHGY